MRTRQEVVSDLPLINDGMICVRKLHWATSLTSILVSCV
jgi:hypothetical protein